MINNSTEKEIFESLHDRESRRVIGDSTSSPLTADNLQDYPDAKKHQIVSFIKSGIRILGYILIPFSLPWAAGILVLSEIVGIIEELV
tara:strand:- start:2839 stop:3102 length:264 start_codon:yes stop_codon:yes gene_type:complete